MTTYHTIYLHAPDGKTKHDFPTYAKAIEFVERYIPHPNEPKLRSVWGIVSDHGQKLNYFEETDASRAAEAEAQ